MAVGTVQSGSMNGTLTGGIFGAVSMGFSIICSQSARKAEAEAKKKLEKRAEERAARESLSNKLVVAWGASGVMEWVSNVPGSVFASGRIFFSVLGRSLSCVLSGMRIYQSVKDLVFYEKLAESGKTTNVRELAQTQFNSTVCSLLAELCFLGYFALQLASVLMGAAIATGLSFLFVAAGMALIVVGCVYSAVTGFGLAPVKKS